MRFQVGRLQRKSHPVIPTAGFANLGLTGKPLSQPRGARQLVQFRGVALITWEPSEVTTVAKAVCQANRSA